MTNTRKKTRANRYEKPIRQSRIVIALAFLPACQLLYDAPGSGAADGAIESPGADGGALGPDSSPLDAVDGSPGKVDAGSPVDASGLACDVTAPSCPGAEGCYWTTAGTAGTCQHAGTVLELEHCDFQEDCAPGLACSYLGCVRMCDDANDCAIPSSYDCLEIIGGEPVKGCFPK